MPLVAVACDCPSSGSVTVSVPVTGAVASSPRLALAVPVIAAASLTPSMVMVTVWLAVPSWLVTVKLSVSVAPAARWFSASLLTVYDQLPSVSTL